MEKKLKETELDEIIVGNPNLLLVALGIWTFLLSLTVGYYTFNSKYFTEVNSESVFIWIFACLLALFGFLGVYMIFTLKKLTLTNTGLTISYPFLSSSRNISFDDICKVYDQNYDIKGSNNFRKYDIYKGKKIVIDLYDSKSIVITSLEITNYDILAQNLKNSTKSYFKVKTDNVNVINTQRYGWFVAAVLFIFFLIVYIVQKKIG